MVFLKQSTAIDIRVGPFVDVGDGFTPEVGVTIAASDEAEILKANGAATVAMTGVFAAVTSCDGWYDYTLAAGDVDTVGELVIVMQDDSVYLPVFVRAYVVEEAVYVAMYGASAAGPLQSTTAARKLDVTATGAAGIDWGNVENKATANDLSATDIQLVDTTTTNTDMVAAAPTAAANADAVWDEVLTGATHNVATSAGRRLRELQESGGYAGAIWVDTVNGSAGTTDFTNGTDTNPVNTIADADTLATSLGISRFMVAPGSSITLAATQANQVFDGLDWTLALGGQSIDGSVFRGALVSGIATNTAGNQTFFDCRMGAVTLPSNTHVVRSGIAGTQTVGETGDYFYDQCDSEMAGTSTPAININSVANVNVSWRHYSGGLQINNAVATTTMSYESDGQIIVAATCTSLTIVVRGDCDITDSGVTTSLTESAAINRTMSLSGSVGSVTGAVGSVTGNVGGNVVGTVASVVGAVGSLVGHTVQTGDSFAKFVGITKLAEWLGLIAGKQAADATALTEIKATGAGSGAYSELNDSLEAIRDRGDASWVTGAGGSDRLIMIDTTIATLASQTSFTLTAGSTDDNAYRGCTCVVEDVSTSTQKAIGIVDTYTGATKTVVLLQDPAVFTMATTDKVYILAEKGLKPTTADDYHVDVGTTGAVDSDLQKWVGVSVAPVIAGRPDVSVGVMQSGVVTAAAIATAAITSAKVEAGAIHATAIAANAITASTIATAAITATKFASGAINAAAIATNALTSAKIATGAIHSTAIAAGAITATEAPNLDAAISTIATPAQVLTQVNAALDTAIAEIAQGVPSATPSLRAAVSLMHMALRNQTDVNTTATDVLEIRNDAGVVIAKKLVTDDGTVYSEAEMVTGP